LTLVELVLVAVVLTILLTAAMPGLRRTSERIQAERAAFELAQLLRLAHERAVTEETETMWVWDAQRRRAYLEPGRMAESSTLPEELSLLLDRTGPAASDECSCIRFFPEGTSEPTALTLTLHDQTYTLTVDGATSHVLLSAGTPAR
jgi:type II secretory pathway pseudopilin PulG